MVFWIAYKIYITLAMSKWVRLFEDTIVNKDDIFKNIMNASHSVLS